MPITREKLHGSSSSFKPLPVAQEISPSKIFCNAIVEEKPTGGVTQVKGAGLWLVDDKMRVVWMNDTMEDIYGPLKEIRNAHCFSAFRGRTSKCKDCLPTEAFTTGNIVSGYVTRTTKDGVQRYYQLVEAPLMDSDNHVTNVLEIVMDVTEKTRMENALRSSEQEYRALFENSGTSVVVCSSEGIVRRVNQAFERLTGYMRDDIENKLTYLHFVHPRDQKRLTNYSSRRKLKEKDVPKSYDFSLLTKSGEEKIVHLELSELENGDQIVSLLDITDKWNLEQEVLNKEQFLSNILHNSLDAIIAINTNGFIRSWNHGAESLFGYRSKEVIGKKFTYLLSNSYKRSEAYKNLSLEFEKQGFLKDKILVAKTKGGKKIQIEMSMSAIQNIGRKRVGASCIIRDVSDKIKSEQRTLQIEKMSVVGELAASLAHEIKNPLNSMVINMEVLKGYLAQLPEEKRISAHKRLEILSSETRRLDNVMRNFLNFAKPVNLQFVKTNLASVIQSAVDLMKAEAVKRKIKFITRLPSQPVFIEGSENHLKQVFINLFLNAFQAMPKSGTLKVSLNTNERDQVEVKIMDTGVGIPKENRSKVFGLYFSTKEKGSGLGLSLAKRFMVMHGGTIQFESKVNHGTEFTLSFPTI